MFTWTSNTPPSPAPTYVNVDDPDIYSGGVVTVGAGSSLLIPIEAQEIGAASSCPPNSISLTTTLLGCSATNPTAIVGSDRETVDLYVSRCKEAAARLSFAGPDDAFAYFAAKNLDGTPLINGLGNQVSITRAQVSGNSTTGVMTVYFASDSGAPISSDIDAANTNIEKNIFAIGDCITYTGQSATVDTLAVAGAVSIKARSGVTAAAVRAGILKALAEYQKKIPIGGFDRDSSGNGVVYTQDLAAAARSGFDGIYNVSAVVFHGISTAVFAGHVVAITSSLSDWTVNFT